MGENKMQTPLFNTLLFLFVSISPLVPDVQLNCSWKDSSSESTQQSSSSSLRCWWRCLWDFTFNTSHYFLCKVSTRCLLLFGPWNVIYNVKFMPVIKPVTSQVTVASNLLEKLHSHSPCTVSLVNLCISQTVIMAREVWESWADWLTVQILSKKQSLLAKGS